MNKYRIVFFNRFACETQTFNVIADDEIDAERLFWLRYNEVKYHDDCIEGIYKVNEEHFYTEEEIIKMINI